jgi:hypothetical protein
MYLGLVPFLRENRVSFYCRLLKEKAQLYLGPFHVHVRFHNRDSVLLCFNKQKQRPQHEHDFHASSYYKKLTLTTPFVLQFQHQNLKATCNFC